MLTDVLSSIAKYERFVLTSHARPDGDAVGSLLAARQILRAIGKHVDAVLSDPVPVIYKPLPHSDSIQRVSAVNGAYECAIILECDSLQRTGVRGLDDNGRL